ncbi:MAG: iron-sulfur cluster assembly protein [Bacteroidales bacterium]|nr:iron-sulfur cluster assembly protein [Bacteroidales bacterium]
MVTKEQIIEVLSTIYDPEIPVNIWELGFIYDIQIQPDDIVNILMTLTAPNCPVAESLPIEVKTKVSAIEGVKGVSLRLTFEPPWDFEMMSEAAKVELGLDF